MSKLLSFPDAAREIGVNTPRVKEWARRAEDPLPTVPVGAFRKVIAAEIQPWLEREAERSRPKSASAKAASR